MQSYKNLKRRNSLNMRTTRRNGFQVTKPIKTLIWVFIGVGIVISIIGYLGIQGYVLPSDVFGFISGLLAGTFGILIGFSLDRNSEREKEERTATDFLKLIREELMDIRLKTPPDIKGTGEIYVLYTDIWDSIVSSGTLCLLDYDQVIKLSRVYKHIKATSFEAEWFRRGWEEYQSIPDIEIYKKNNYVGKKLNELGTAQIARLKTLRNEIDDILKEDWWS